MFQAPDLTLIVEFIFMFYKEKPIDWLLDHILWVKVCNPEKDAVSEFLMRMEEASFLHFMKVTFGEPDFVNEELNRWLKENSVST